ncbi:hypothetical protein ADUPG1_009374 [Aduncisulcus paluster]|uniref:Protein kinase domain-containing protein n=1 Tax=Aduncisulcus paluster TaxID=2918883 RepID=A0ABQ5KVF1_9EUKA|nr:hypothetical protein ADUPG1_009374 [Aduncisulcus paluster]
MDPKPSSERSQDIIQEVKPKFIHEGDESSSPIPRDSPNVKSPDITVIEAKNRTKGKGDEDYDQSINAQKMMKGEEIYWGGNGGVFTDISLPFSTSTPIKGAYICIGEESSSSPPSHLIFSLTSSKGEKMFKKYEFPELENDSWFYLPIDLSDVVLCEISGKGRKKESFEIESLIFFREETHEETIFREAKEAFRNKLWSDAPVVKPEFVQEGGRDSIPIPPDGPKLVDPSFSKVKGKDDAFSKESEYYDQSSDAQEMLKGECSVYLSHLSIPFPSPSPMKGAYICVDEDYSSPSLLFTFTDCDGKKTSKKYEFTRPEHSYEWHFLPIDLDNVVLCEIEGKGMWKMKNCRGFIIPSLVFFREETPEERCIRESIEEQWSKAPTIKSEFVNSGNASAIPIPRGNAAVNNPSFEMVKGKHDSYCKESEEYDRSEKAQKMLKGEGEVTLSHLSIPFPSPSPMKGAYICVNEYDSSPSLLFTLTDCDGKKTSKKYEFTKPENDYEWHFLPIDLDNVVLCEIEGKGMWKEKNSRCFDISSLIFFREETPEERCIRESIEEQWSKAPTIKSEFIHEGDESSSPIPRDCPNIKSPDITAIESKNRTKRKGDREYDQCSAAQKMMKGEGNRGKFTDISLPFSTSTPIKGAYICIGGGYTRSTSHLIFSLTSSKGSKMFKKYEFPELENDSWFFLPIDLSDVVLCEITGKGRKKEYFEDEESSKIDSLVEEEYFDDIFSIVSLVFIREETLDEVITREAEEKLWSEAPVVKPEFVKEGDGKSQGRGFIPISRDDPNVIDPSFSKVKCKDDSVSKESEEYDQSSNAQRMLKGECSVYLSHLSIPFPSPSPMKGAYICVNKNASSPSLLFTLTDCDGKKTSKKYEFTKPEHSYEWHFLPIDLDNVVLCEIEGKGMWKEKNSRYFHIPSLVFFREETPEERCIRESIEEQWSKAPTIKSEFVNSGNASAIPIPRGNAAPTIKSEFVNSGNASAIPIPRGNAAVNNPSFEMVKGKHDSYCKESEEYDRSEKAQKMLKGEGEVTLSHLSIPFPSPSPMKGAYICVDKDYSTPSLLFTFTDCDDKKTSKKYEFAEPEYSYEYQWVFLPFGISDVKKCEIQEKGSWEQGRRRSFSIRSLIFVRGDDIPPSPISFFSPISMKIPSITRKSELSVSPLCKIGSGLFGEVLLVKVDIPIIHCVLKKVIPLPDMWKIDHRDLRNIIRNCRNEFENQLKLFSNPLLSHRIPRPLYILDLFDEDYRKGLYGFIMEYCAGGSVEDFAKSWCFDSSRTNPLKLSALCVGMIECLDDVFEAKSGLVHRDIKPANFLVRVDSKDGECIVVLADLGLMFLQETISSSLTHSTRMGTTEKEPQQPEQSTCGTLVYNSPEAFRGIQDQRSDGYSLGVSILALFLGYTPYSRIPILQRILDPSKFIDCLLNLMKEDKLTKLSDCPIFQSLKPTDSKVYNVMNEVFIGLTQYESINRMSVHEAREKVQIIKDSLPRIGEGWKCPKIEDIIKRQGKLDGDICELFGNVEGKASYGKEGGCDGLYEYSDDSVC